MANQRKAFRKVEQILREQGGTAKDVKGGTMWLHPNGTGKATVHGTPSDPRAWKNTLADLRRAGFDIPRNL